MTCYFFFICLSIHCLGRHSFIVNFHDMDNRLITMSTAPNNPNLSHPTLVLPRQHHPAAGSAGFRYQGLEESTSLLCLHLPIRPHGTKNFLFFYIMTHEYYDSFKFFNVYAFIRRRKLFVAKKEVSEGDARGHIQGGEEQGRHGHGGTQICLARKIFGRTWVLEYVLSLGELATLCFMRRVKVVQKESR